MAGIGRAGECEPSERPSPISDHRPRPVGDSRNGRGSRIPLVMAISNSSRQIERFLVWNFRGALAAVAIVLGVWALYPLPITLGLASVVALNALIVRSAERIARRGEHERAAVRFTLSAWLVTSVVGLLVPVLFPLSMLVAFLPLGLIIPYGSRRVQLRAFAGCGAIAALIAGATFFPPLVSIDSMPDLVAHGMNVFFVPLLAALFCLSVWDGFELLQETHRELLTSHEALRESESSLEHKVAERTTQLERSRRELASARDDAVAANAAKSRFLAAASHDLRQPIHALRLFAEALGEGDDRARMRDLARRIRDSADSLTAMFDELLDLSRLESGGVEARLADFPVGPLVDQLVAELEPDATAKGIALARVATSAVVHSDPLLLRRILQNLLVNALRHSEQGRILIGGRRRGGELRIEVWDTGPGIPASMRSEIFREFTQLDQKRRSEGLGLGLAIVERLAKLLGCRIELDSWVGRGSVFRICVPLATRPRALAQPPADASAAVSMAGQMIVVVDDDLQILESMRVLLEGWGAELVLARSAEDALEGLAQRGRAPDVIIADYSLDRGATGVEAIEVVRRSYGPRIPALVITGETDPAILERVRAASLPHLTKPIPPARLRAALAYARRGDTETRSR